MPSASRFMAPPRKNRRGRAQSEMAQESLTQVSGSFLESSTAKMDAPAVCTQKRERKRSTEMMMMIGRGHGDRYVDLHCIDDQEEMIVPRRGDRPC